MPFKVQTTGFTIRSKSQDSAEIVIYGPIGSFWDDTAVSAKSFSDELNKLDKGVKNITVRINSPGGDVFDGISIYNRLKQHPANITVYVDGLAASIASIISLAGDKIVMGEGALFMIHLPSTFAGGDRRDFDTIIDRLMDVEEQLISIYAKKTKLTRSEIRQMLEKETWFDSSETVKMGFADEVQGESMPIAASMLNKATWINKSKMPKIKTSDDVAREDINALKNKVESFLARKK